MRDRFRFGVLVLAMFAVVLGLAVVTPAQEAEEQAADAATAEEEQAIEEALRRQPFAGEITVTSRRVEENIQDVPIAVSVVTGDHLMDVQATDISAIESYVPNVSIYQGRNQSTTLTAFIRGVGQSDPLWGVDPGVGLYIDDVYIARAQGALLDVYDVARVEVLRGPQGTLYGKNTIGGAIKYVTKPMSDTPEGSFSLGYGSFGTQEYRFNLNGPIVEGKLRGKIAAAKLLRDGYGTNLYQNRDVSDKDTTAYRAALEWLPSDNVTLQVSYDHTEDDAEPVGLTRLQPNYLCPTFLGVPCPPLPDLFDTESGLAPLNSTDSDGYSLTLTWDISDALRFKSITAYRETESINSIDFDTTPATIIDTGPAFYFDDQTTQEFQLAYTGGGRLSGVVGFYYFDGSAGGNVKANFFGSLFTTTQGSVDTTQYAIYADGNYSLTDKLTLNLGLRPTREEKHGKAFNVYNTDNTFTDYYFVAADFDDEVTFDSWAPKLGLDYQFNPDVMGYVSVNRGFKSGGYNVRAQSTVFPESALPFDDEVMTVAEVGVKSVLANRRLVLNTAVFYGEYTDIQVSTFTSYDSNGDGTEDAFYGNFLNAGDATIQGLEVEYAYASDSWYGLSGFLAYLDAEPDSFLDENNDGFVDTQVITNAPEWTGAIRFNVDFPAFGGLITGSVGYSYRDDSMLTNEGGPNPLNPTQPIQPIVQDAYGLVDAWIAWLSPGAKWRIGLSGRNLTDEEYLMSGYNLPAQGIHQGSYGAPRTVVGTIEFRFF
ncbi:MAG TPA: TonB-dependent receptor [Candidatus Sulfomarinibacteraceae bacterium]|nr:TonB-dependent receptor [Candidatus Sulfomarinibacteraceae bacterium]